MEKQKLEEIKIRPVAKQQMVICRFSLRQFDFIPDEKIPPPTTISQTDRHFPSVELNIRELKDCLPFFSHHAAMNESMKAKTLAQRKQTSNIMPDLHVVVTDEELNKMAKLLSSNYVKINVRKKS